MLTGIFITLWSSLHDPSVIHWRGHASTSDGASSLITIHHVYDISADLPAYYKPQRLHMKPIAKDKRLDVKLEQETKKLVAAAAEGTEKVVKVSHFYRAQIQRCQKDCGQQSAEVTESRKDLI